MRHWIWNIERQSGLTWRSWIEYAGAAGDGDASHARDVAGGGHRRDRRVCVRSRGGILSSAVLVHLGRVAAAGVLVLDRRQLARVVRVRVRSATEASSRHRIQRLGKIGGSLQNDLLWQTFWISRVPRDQFAQSAEPVINRGLVEGWNCSFSYCQLFLYRLIDDWFECNVWDHHEDDSARNKLLLELNQGQSE